MAVIPASSTRVASSPFALLRALSRPSLIALFVALAAVVSGAVTYATLTGLAPFEPTPGILVIMLLVNVILVLALGALIAWRMTRLWAQRRDRAAGARLHVRLVGMFAAIAVVPAILVAIFAAVSLNLGIEAWFSQRVQTALANSVSVADAYVTEHRQVIRGDILAMAFDLDRAAPILQNDSKRFSEYLVTQAAVRALPAVYVIDSSARVLASAKKPELLTNPNPPDVSQTAIDQAKEGKVVILTSLRDDVVSALYRLDAFVDAYLLVSRSVDPQVLDHQRHTIDAVSEYQRLDENRSEIQLTFLGLYVVVAMLILLAAVWLAFWAANRIVTPIGRLASAAGRVSEGDLRVRVEVGPDDDEIGLLSDAFNRMTSQLEGQRNELVDANAQIDMRRRFTEAVLAGVSAGVVGLDGEGNITLINRAAARLLGVTPSAVESTHYSVTVPEVAGLIRRAMTETSGRVRGQVDLSRDGALRHLNVQVSREAGEGSHGFVVTFDDITDLVSAQRTAAWADVARRIAHEIKNPLTPIQLSAERLQRKYGKEISSDPEVFDQCTETIIRQVGDIGRMVDEFSSFARMPQPVIRPEQAQELVRHAVFLQRVAHPQIQFVINAPEEPAMFECDGRLVSQALTNVLKNAGEAIAARRSEGDETPGRIVVDVTAEAGSLVIAIHDNGIGLPAEHRHRLTEPYVTTRAKGTGLGLAIVRKILEDHGGELRLENEADDRGAVISMIFPIHHVVQPAPAGADQGLRHEQERVAGRV